MKRLFILSCLGFESIHDFFTTIFITKYKMLNVFALLFGGFSFINNLWADVNEFIFLWVLLFVDLITGVIKAFKLKEFNSKRLPRWAGISFTYCLLLFLSFNLGKYVPAFEFLSGSLYALFCAVLFVSLVENLNAMGLLNIQVYNWLKEKIGGFIK